MLSGKTRKREERHPGSTLCTARKERHGKARGEPHTRPCPRDNASCLITPFCIHLSSFPLPLRTPLVPHSTPPDLHTAPPTPPLPQQRRAIIHHDRIQYPFPLSLAFSLSLSLLLPLTLTILLIEPKNATLPLQLLHNPTRPLRRPPHTHAHPPSPQPKPLIILSLRLFLLSFPPRPPTPHPLPLHMQTPLIAITLPPAARVRLTIPIPLPNPIRILTHVPDRGTIALPHHNPLLDQPLDLHPISDKQQLRKRALLPGLQHPRQALRRRIAQNIPKIPHLTLGPNRHRPTKPLQPNLRPILAQRSWQQLQMPQHLEPLVEVELEVLLSGGAEEAAAPAAPAAVRDGAADGAAAGEEEEVDVRVDLADDAEVDVEVRVERLERDIGAETPVFPLMPERIRRQGSRAGMLHHQHDGVENARHRGRREHRGPDHAVGRREVVDQDGGRVRIRGHARHVEDAARALVRFAEGGAAAAEPAAFARPGEGVEARARAPPAPAPGEEGVLAGGDVVGEGGDEQAAELGVGARGDHGGDERPAGRARDHVGEQGGVEEGFDDAEVVVGEGGAAGEAERGAAEVGVQVFG